jgi:hypothetical protein
VWGFVLTETGDPFLLIAVYKLRLAKCAYYGFAVQVLGVSGEMLMADKQCYHCHGSGKTRCVSCGGMGNIHCTSCGGKGTHMTGTIHQSRCNTCSGSGRAKCTGFGCYYGQKNCDSCGGSGKIWTSGNDSISVSPPSNPTHGYEAEDTTGIGGFVLIAILAFSSWYFWPEITDFFSRLSLAETTTEQDDLPRLTIDSGLQAPAQFELLDWIGCTTSAVSVRAGPSVKHQKVFSFPAGMRVKILAGPQGDLNDPHATWVFVHSPHQGYVSGKYIQLYMGAGEPRDCG